MAWAEGSKREPSVHACCRGAVSRTKQGKKARADRRTGGNEDCGGGTPMKTAFWLAGATALALSIPRGCGRYDQDRLCLHLQRADRRDRQRYAQLLRTRARPSRPQDGRQAGRSHLRGRPAEARCGKAEDREAGAVRQGGFHRRLYLVERAARLAQDRGGFADLPDLGQCRTVATRRRTCARLTCSRPPGKTTRRRRRWAFT